MLEYALSKAYQALFVFLTVKLGILTLLFFKLNAVVVPLFFMREIYKVCYGEKSVEGGRFIVVDLVEQIREFNTYS